MPNHVKDKRVCTKCHRYMGQNEQLCFECESANYICFIDSAKTVLPGISGQQNILPQFQMQTGGKSSSKTDNKSTARNEKNDTRIFPNDAESRTYIPYMYDWTIARHTYLRENPYCKLCEIASKKTRAVDVIHVIPVDSTSTAFWDPSNWQSVCQKHYEERTIMEKQINLYFSSIKKEAQHEVKIKCPKCGSANASWAKGLAGYRQCDRCGAVFHYTYE